jgi:ABC-type transport system involved in multi-copper enzyme maturation permease subunit
LTAIKDAVLIARFELLRALRTWRALSLVAIYLVCTSGTAWMFTRVIRMFEHEAARTLGIATTDTPGAMMAELSKTEMWRGFLSDLTGRPELVEALVSVPAIAVFHLWVSFILVPMFAATAAAESVALDTSTRAIRYEALRTGRFEIAVGRYLGQLLLTGTAGGIGLFGTLAVGLGFMVGNSPFLLFATLVVFTFKAWLFAMPFVGMGVAISLMTSSAAWARVLALGGVAGSWVVFGVLRATEDRAWMGPIGDVLLPILPQTWLSGFWEPGLGSWPTVLVCAGLGASAVSLAAIRFVRRDL